jgi:hypothetical protein
MSQSPKDQGRFFKWIEPATHEQTRVGWYGPIDLGLLKWFRDHTGDVPAPFWMEHHRGTSPREMIAAQFAYKPRFIGPASLRHRRTMSDWIAPTTWPLLAAAHANQIIDGYHAHFCVVPSQSAPTREQLRKFLFRCDWSIWCNAADELGFLGIETNEGFPPFVIAFSATISARLLAEPNFRADGEPPRWYIG